MTKKKSKAKGIAQMTPVLSKKLQDQDIKLIANTIMYKLQDEGKSFNQIADYIERYL